MKQLFLIAAVLTCLDTALSAQQTPYLRFFQNNWQFLNPALLDRHMALRQKSEYRILNIQTRQQWIGFKGAPTTIFLSGEKKVASSYGDKGGPKFGFTAYFDKTDAFSSFGLMGNYAYLLYLPASKSYLQFGLNVGLESTNLNTSAIIPTLTDPDDDVIVQFARKTLLNFTPGIVFRNPQVFYMGLSFPQGVKAYAWKQGGKSGLYERQFEQISFNMGGFIPISSDRRDRYSALDEGANEVAATFTLEPSLWVRATPNIRYMNLLGNESPFSFDANVRLYGFDYFWGGIGYGSNGNATIEMGMNTNRTEKSGYRIGIMSNFPFLGRNPSLGTSVELFGSYFIRGRGY